MKDPILDRSKTNPESATKVSRPLPPRRPSADQKADRSPPNPNRSRKHSSTIGGLDFSSLSMLKKVCESQDISKDEIQQALQILASLSPLDLAKVQRRAHASILSDRGPNRPTSAVEVDKYLLTFSNVQHPIPLNVEVRETLTLVAKTDSPRFRFRVINSDSRYKISVGQSAGVIQDIVTQIDIYLVLRALADVDAFILVDVEGGPRHFIRVSTVVSTETRANQQPQRQQQPQYTRSERSHSLHNAHTSLPRSPQQQRSQQKQPSQDLVEDTIIPGFPHNVPKSLAMLRASLISRDAFRMPGIFIEHGDRNEVEVIMENVQRGQAFRSNDVYAIAGVIKEWFGDLGFGMVLNEVPADMLAGIGRGSDGGEEAALDATRFLSAQNLDLLEWVLDLMLEILALRRENQIEMRDICTVWAPYLFGPSSESKSNVMQYRMAMVHVPTFVSLLLSNRMRVVQ